MSKVIHQKCNHLHKIKNDRGQNYGIIMYLNIILKLSRVEHKYTTDRKFGLSNTYSYIKLYHIQFKCVIFHIITVSFVIK